MKENVHPFITAHMLFLVNNYEAIMGICGKHL